jgi:hypothetical protein
VAPSEEISFEPPLRRLLAQHLHYLSIAGQVAAVCVLGQNFCLPYLCASLINGIETVGSGFHNGASFIYQYWNDPDNTNYFTSLQQSEVVTPVCFMRPSLFKVPAKVGIVKITNPLHYENQQTPDLHNYSSGIIYFADKR